jgi:small subunit ribosomal protein S6
MKQESPNTYEGMYIIRPSLSEEARKGAFQKILDGIESNGGEIVKVHEQGRRRLAYEIDKCYDGYYYLVYFSTLPSAVKNMWQEYHLHEDLLRFMTLRTEKVLETIEFEPLVK